MSAETSLEHNGLNAVQHFNFKTPIYRDNAYEIIPKFIKRSLDFKNPEHTQILFDRWALGVTLALKEVVDSPFIDQDIDAYLKKMQKVLSGQANAEIAFPNIEKLYVEEKERFKDAADPHHQALDVANDTRRYTVHQRSVEKAVSALLARASGPRL